MSSLSLTHFLIFQFESIRPFNLELPNDLQLIVRHLATQGFKIYVTPKVVFIIIAIDSAAIAITMPTIA